MSQNLTMSSSSKVARPKVIANHSKNQTSKQSATEDEWVDQGEVATLEDALFIVNGILYYALKTRYSQYICVVFRERLPDWTGPVFQGTMSLKSNMTKASRKKQAAREQSFEDESFQGSAGDKGYDGDLDDSWSSGRSQPSVRSLLKVWKI